MSQFSHSLHFRGTPSDLLAGCSAVPVVVATNESWTTFLPHGPGSAESTFVAQGVVVFWRYAEDHGWDFEVREGQEAVFTYSQSWDPSPRPAKSKGSASRAAELVGLDLGRFRSLISDVPADYERGASNAFEFASALKLPVVDCLSPETIREVTGCATCPVLSPLDRGPWTCPNCGETETSSYPPEPKRAPAAPSPESLRMAAIRQQLGAALRQAAEASLLELVPEADIEGLTDELLAAMEELAGAPNREAALTEWLLEHEEVEEVYGTDAEIMDAFK